MRNKLINNVSFRSNDGQDPKIDVNLELVELKKK